MSYKTSGNSGAFAWFYQRITGIFLFVILLLHFTIMHFAGTGDVTFDVIKDRLADPYWKMLDLSFVVFALYHGLNGIWMAIQDYIHSEGWRTVIYTLLVLLGLFLFFLAAVTLIPFGLGKI